jgi:hypothetical protein
MMIVFATITESSTCGVVVQKNATCGSVTTRKMTAAVATIFTVCPGGPEYGRDILCRVCATWIHGKEYGTAAQ